MEKDWRNADAYQYIADLPPKWQAWEFLRRNQEYQDAFRKAIATYQGDMPIDDQNFSVSTEAVDYLDRWWTPYLVNPETDRPLWLSFMVRFGHIYHGGRPDTLHGGEPTTVNLCKNTVAVTFDLSLPIRPQIIAAESNLRNWQEYDQKWKGLKVVKSRLRSDFITCIRAWDARQSGALLKDIAKVLFPKESDKRVSDTVSQAKQLINGGYKSIIIAGYRL